MRLLRFELLRIKDFTQQRGSDALSGVEDMYSGGHWGPDAADFSSPSRWRNGTKAGGAYLYVTTDPRHGPWIAAIRASILRDWRRWLEDFLIEMERVVDAHYADYPAARRESRMRDKALKEKALLLRPSRSREWLLSFINGRRSSQPHVQGNQSQAGPR